MSLNPCTNCGKFIGVIGTTIYTCECGHASAPSVEPAKCNFGHELGVCDSPKGDKPHHKDSHYMSPPCKNWRAVEGERESAEDLDDATQSNIYPTPLEAAHARIRKLEAEVSRLQEELKESQDKLEIWDSRVAQLEAALRGLVALRGSTGLETNWIAAFDEAERALTKRKG